MFGERGDEIMTSYTRLVSPKFGSSSASTINVIAVGQLCVSIVALALLWNFRSRLVALPLSYVCNVGTLSVLITVFFSYRVSRERTWAPSTIYLVVLSLFHFGLTFVYGLGYLSDDTRSHVSSWFFESYTKEAALTACLGLWACCIGIQMSLLNSNTTRRDFNRPATCEDASLRLYLGQMGAILVVGGVVAWFLFVLSAGGVGLLFSSYVDYLYAMENYSTGYIWLSLGVGLSFLAAANPSKLRLFATMIFCGWALIALPLGLRGEVLFCSVAAVVILARKGSAPSARTTILCGMLILFSISVLQNVREVGVEQAPAGQVSGNILDSFTELGSSLRPLTATTLWREQGDDLLHGASYWAPFDRAACKFLPARRCVSAFDDDRLLNEVAKSRIGPIGFSPMAEAYRNFGRVGVVFVMVIIGVLLGRLGTWPSTPIRDAFIGLLLVEMLINVRNAFIQVPSHIVFGVICIAIVVSLAKLTNNTGRSHKGHRVRSWETNIDTQIQ